MKDLKEYLPKKKKLDAIYLEIELRDSSELKRIAKSQGLTMSAVIRALIKKYIDDFHRGP